ncbi:MAG: hypothetical protein ACJ79H_14040, partial [Myxococcales bacterium]
MLYPADTSRSRLHEFIRATLMTAAAVVGLGALAPTAFADSVPTGLPASPTFGIQKFTQPMPR